MTSGVEGSRSRIVSTALCFLLPLVALRCEAQQAGLRKDAGACQLAQAVVNASGFGALAAVTTETEGTFTLASTGESDPVHILTSGTDKTRMEITTSAGKSVRILNAGLVRFHPSEGVTRTLSPTNTFHERIPTNPVLSLLAECESPNVQAIDDGEVTQDGVLLHKIVLSWTASPDHPTSIVAQDELNYSKTSYFIDPQQNTVTEMEEDHFAENDATVPFHYRRLYSAYKSEYGHLIPHTIATYINSRLFDTITVVSYQESSQVDPQAFALEGLQ